MRMPLLLLPLLIITGCKEQEPKELPKSAQKDIIESEVSWRCPNGHNTIRFVPITYGRIAMTPEFREKEKNLEIAFGGCCKGKYGDFKIACTTCGAHTYAGDSPWFDRTTKVINDGVAIRGNINKKELTLRENKQIREKE